MSKNMSDMYRIDSRSIREGGSRRQLPLIIGAAVLGAKPRAIDDVLGRLESLSFPLLRRN